MITTVTLNPAIDKTITVEGFQPDTVNRASRVQENLGGKGINVTKVLTLLGTGSTALGFIGQRNIGRVMGFVQQEKLTTNFIPIDDLTRINIKVIDPLNRSTTDINEPGFTVTEKHIEQISQLIEHFSTQSSFMVFSGSVCRGVKPEDFTFLLKSCAPSCKVVLDADGVMLEAGLKAAPFLIKPNIHELEKLVGAPLEIDEEILSACRHLIKTTGVQNILVSMGEHGSLLVTREKAYKASALKVEVVSTVGAGDSMLAGFLHRLNLTHDLGEALKFAAATGSLAVSGVSTDALKTLNILDFVDQIKLETL